MAREPSGLQMNGESSNCTSPNASSPGSRIPRPLGSPLRRSSSLRVKGERRYGNHDHHHIHHPELFPVITENSDGSPQKFSSLSLTPVSRNRRSAGSSLGLHNAGGGDDCSDVDSVKSFGSNYSTASACDHATFALNGTTWSGRSKRYVIHCSSSAHADPDSEYLTPTQRAVRQVRRYQALLKEAKKEIDEKEQEIFRLTKELVELRLYKALLNSPEDKTDSSDAPTVRESKSFTLDSPTKSKDESPVQEEQIASPPRTPEKKPDSSLVDSGHFEDGSVHSKESVCNAIPGLPMVHARKHEAASTSHQLQPSSPRLTFRDVSNHQNDERKSMVDHYENRIEEMHRRHVDEIQLLKQAHNDKVESLLYQLTEMSTRFCEIHPPSLDATETKLKESEALIEALKTELAEQKVLLADQEERNKQMYLKMYSKGQQAARMEQADQIINLDDGQKNSKVTVAELLQQLSVTQAENENIKPSSKESSLSSEALALALSSQSLLNVQEAVSLWVLGTRKAMYRRIVESRNSQGALDPEITLQFLKSAIYYFLTDKDNLQGHLKAIESILGFTESEKLNIDKIYRAAKK